MRLIPQRPCFIGSEGWAAVRCWLTDAAAGEGQQLGTRGTRVTHLVLFRVLVSYLPPASPGEHARDEREVRAENLQRLQQETAGSSNTQQRELEKCMHPPVLSKLQCDASLAAIQDRCPCTAGEPAGSRTA